MNKNNFVDYLLQIGEGKETVYSNLGEDVIKLPDEIILHDENIESLILEIFNNINDYYKDSNNYINYIKDRAILTTKNKDVDDINKKIINIFPENAYEFLSADSVKDRDLV